MNLKALDGRKHRNRPCTMNRSEIVTILVCFHFNQLFNRLSDNVFGKLFADKGYISQELFDRLFNDGVNLVSGLKCNMKNKLMPLYDKRDNNLSAIPYFFRQF